MWAQMTIKDIADSIQRKIDELSDNSYQLGASSAPSQLEKIKQFVANELKSQDLKIQKRVYAEFFEYGPLEELLNDSEICEILINGPDSIWFEKNGKLCGHPEFFLSPITYRNILDRICHAANVYPTAEHPIIDGHMGLFRLNFVRSEVHPNSDILSLRRHPQNSWTLKSLKAAGWCNEQDEILIRSWITAGKSFLVIGPTSSGKTSILSACLAEIQNTERALILEDSSEIKIPNNVSTKLLTRKDAQQILPEIGLSELLRTSLRLRPDRIVIGEMRGAEAKDFLMALSSGHRGSLSSLHADDASQALMRLEMLVQLGAPQWNINTIRKLIHLSLDGVLVTGRDDQGKRKFKGIYSISSLEDNGFTLERSGTESILSDISSDKAIPLSLTSF
jgi:pilus assembly protein CpaF